MSKKKRTHKKIALKFKLPKLKLKWQLLLYLFTFVTCVFSIASTGLDAIPSWVKIVVYAPACCSLFFSCYYMVSSSRFEIQKVVSEIIARHSLLAYLSADYRRRTFLFAIPGFVLNLLFAGFNAVIGIRSRSAWYISLAVYYVLLCLMRAYLLHYEFLDHNAKKEGGNLRREWKLYFRCGGILTAMGILFSGVVILMVTKGYRHSYPGYLIYVVAIYTFSKVIFSVVNIFKARKTKVPLLIGIRNIGYADAMVSMLSLQTAMFAAFGNNQKELTVTMNTLTGIFVCAMVVLMGVIMLITAWRQQRRLKEAMSVQNQKNC